MAAAGVGEVGGVDLVGHGRVRGGAVLADRAGLVRIDGARDLGAVPEFGYRGLDGLLVLGGGYLLAVRRDEDDAGGGAVGGSAGEPLLHQVEGFLRLDPRHGEGFLLRLRRGHAGKSYGGQHGGPDKGNGPAPPEGRAAQSIQKSSHGEVSTSGSRRCLQTPEEGGVLSSSRCRHCAVLKPQYYALRGSHPRTRAGRPQVAGQARGCARGFRCVLFRSVNSPSDAICSTTAHQEGNYG